MKNILLPTDFSDNAWNAIFYALKLFGKVPCHFYILNAYDPNPTNSLGSKTSVRVGMLLKSMAESSVQEMKKIERYFEEHYGNEMHAIDYISARGNLVEVVKNTQRKQRIDTIIMGTQGATGAKQIFLGSTTVQLMKSVRNCPLIAVPEKYNFQGLKQIVFPTDFTHFYERYELEPLLDMISLWDAALHVFYIAQEFSLSEAQKLNKKMLEERFKGINFKYHEVALKDNISRGIHQFAKTQNAEMVALMHYKHTFMEKLTQEAVVKNVGFHTEVPLLVMPNMVF
ncbi:universal stress protein [Spongiimicrobium salis]|uniref:universal stress protein n=1 Tax=Spongiimicrobium salis TaxID=1667022 RepID=UPI00374D9565